MGKRLLEIIFRHPTSILSGSQPKQARIDAITQGLF
jgi:hypothetical protein